MNKKILDQGQKFLLDVFNTPQIQRSDYELGFCDFSYKNIMYTLYWDVHESIKRSETPGKEEVKEFKKLKILGYVPITTKFILDNKNFWLIYEE